MGRWSGRAAVALAIGLAASAWACTRGRTPFDDPDALVVAMHSGFTEQVVAAAEPWQKAHPEVKLSLAPYRPVDFAQAMIPRLLSGSDVPDVMIVDAGFLELAGRSGTLQDLSAPPFSAGPLLAGFPAANVAQAHVGGALVGIPADAAPTVLFYRKDLLALAGVTEAELTDSWEGFVAACGKLQAATRTYCVARIADLADAVLRADLPDGRSPFFSASGEPLGDESRFAHAFALARAAHQARIDAGPAAGTDQWVELFRRGFFAVQLGEPTTVRRLEALGPRWAGEWRSAPLPGGARVPATSAFCALSAPGTRKARAWDFVREVCLEKRGQLRAWRRARAFPAAPAAAGSPDVEEPVSFLGDQVVGPAWRAASALPVPGTNKLDAYARDAVGLELDYAVQDGKPFEKAMADARARIRQQLERGKK